MKFSILIPVYNVEKYIKECLDSVMAQNYSDFEVLIVDDGSTDKSGIICDEYKQHFPEKIQVIHKENQGLISARRVAISQARGDFCVFVDSDDMVKPNLLREVARVLQQDKDAEIVMYTFQYLLKGSIGKKFSHSFQDGQIWEGRTKRDLYTCLISGSSIDALWIKAIKTTLLKADTIQYNRYYSLNMSEDTLQTIYPFTAAKKIVYIDKALYLYRLIDTSMSHDFSAETIIKRDTMHVYYTLLEYFPVWRMDDADSHLRINARWFNEAMYTFCKYYENASSRLEKNRIIDFNWDMFIPPMNWPNPYVSAVYLRIYTALKSKKRIGIDLFFFHKNTMNKLKRLRKLIKQSWSNPKIIVY